MLFPVFAFLQGDALGLVLLVRHDETAREFANKLIESTIMRVPPIEDPRVYFNGQPIEGNAILAQVGVTALDRLDVRRAEVDARADV